MIITEAEFLPQAIPNIIKLIITKIRKQKVLYV